MLQIRAKHKLGNQRVAAEWWSAKNVTLARRLGKLYRRGLYIIVMMDCVGDKCPYSAEKFAS
jgi:hypothetical protein